MLPPILEIFVIWHPNDTEGEEIAQEFIHHFHASAFTGLIGGAIEVFVRSEPWNQDAGPPRPIPSPTSPLPHEIAHAKYNVVVPLLGTEMAAETERDDSSWHSYLRDVAALKKDYPDDYALFPYLMDRGADDNTKLGSIFGEYQQIASSPCDDGDSPRSMRCRELSQGITQFLTSPDFPLLKVFISHTKRSSEVEGNRNTPKALIDLTRQVIRETRLQEFIDTNDLQPGQDWDHTLRENAASSALLAIRSDLYASREWCQREVRLAKQFGMPVVTLDALQEGEERGSFIMDHVPRITCHSQMGDWDRSVIYLVLNTLVDESLKRELWRCQRQLAETSGRFGVSWWASHAPEPLTLIDWLKSMQLPRNTETGDSAVRILHPDPPLGHDEKQILSDALSLYGFSAEIMTPRQIAARGG